MPPYEKRNYLAPPLVIIKTISYINCILRPVPGSYAPPLTLYHANLMVAPQSLRNVALVPDYMSRAGSPARDNFSLELGITKKFIQIL